MSSQQGAVTRQAQSKRFREAIHRVGSEHTGTRTTGRAGRSFVRFDFGVVSTTVCGNYHGVNQVQLVLGQRRFSRFHRATRYKNHGYVEAHGRVEHSGCDLVAIRDANHGIGTVRIHHVLDRVCNDVPRGQAIEHAVMTHCNAVIDRNGVEFFGDTACVFNFTRDQLSQIFEMDMPRHELCE